MDNKILIVEDIGYVSASIKRLLATDGYTALPTNPDKPYEDALKVWNREEDLRLALVDLKIPDPETGEAKEKVGFQLIKELKKRSNARISVISAYETHPNLAQAASIGADGFIGKDWKPERVLSNVGLLQNWVQATSDLEGLREEIESESPYLIHHMNRVGDYCRHFIRHLVQANPTNFNLAACLAAAELHDIGMINIPDDIWVGPCAINLAPEKRRLIESHIDSGIDKLDHLGARFQEVINIIKQHHRRYRDPDDDSQTDYPTDGNLKRESNIPLEARVLHLADAFDTLLSDRPHRSRMQLADALKEIEKDTNEGKFDPAVVVALKILIKREPDLINALVEENRYNNTYHLYLYFDESNLTSEQRQNLLSIKSDINSISEEEAIESPTLIGVEPPKKNGRNIITVKLAGSVWVVNEAFRFLKGWPIGGSEVRIKGLRQRDEKIIRDLLPVSEEAEICESFNTQQS